MTTEKKNVLIASYLEPDLVERIRAVDSRLNVVYDPELIATPAFPADHNGMPFTRTPEQEKVWRGYLKQAEILFDFDRTHLDDLPEQAPNVKWLQATSSGIGQKLHNLKYDLRMPDTIFTSARGVHAQPLAEFCMMIMLAFNKKFLPTIESQRKKHWARFAGTDLRNKTIGIIGMGKVGREVARMAKCFGMNVLGMKKEVEGVAPSSLNADELYGMNQFERILPRSQYLVLIAPHTPETEKMIGRNQLGMLPEGAILINIGRGALVDQLELVKALESGHLGGAGLDVFEEEPLPQDSPLWNMENVIVSPHSGSTSDSENTLIVELFCENLRRYLNGEPLLNVIDIERMF